MKHTVKMIAAVLSVMIAGTAIADAPLMVIRFNQKNVYYQKPLYNAISKALEAKPDAQFDIVAISNNPTTGNRNLGRVLATLNEIGLPANRYSVSRRSANVEADEVRIFAH